MDALLTFVSPWLLMLAIFVLIDALKVYLEIWNRPLSREFDSDLSDVTALIATYNGASLLGETIQGLLKAGLVSDQILVIDDASTDNTREVLSSFGVRFYTVEHMGKVSAINFGVHRVNTKYVLLIDDDTRIGEARIPTGLLDEYDAVAFNVVPDRRSRYGPHGSNFISNLQRYEYLKSMEIGRRFQDGTASIACVSGAIGLFKKERLQAFHHEHHGAFQGEDLERTLIEHLFQGKVVFVDEMVWTVVPDSFPSLIKQRLLGWYPAIYHSFRQFLRLLSRPGTSLRLRHEMAYNIFVVVFEPLRMFSLCYLIYDGRLLDLLILYGLYLLLELYPFWIIKGKSVFDQRAGVLLIFPVYNIFQMVLRQLALLVWIWKRFISKDMKPKNETDRRWSISPAE